MCAPIRCTASTIWFGIYSIKAFSAHKGKSANCNLLIPTFYAYKIMHFKFICPENLMKLHILHTNTACNLANHPYKENLAKFGYKWDINVVTFNHPSVFLGTYWDLIKKSVYFFFFCLEACQSKTPKTIFLNFLLLILLVRKHWLLPQPAEF